MHWADHAAQRLAERGDKHVIATGITPSGHIHVGNMREVLTGDMLRRACEDAGLDAELIYIADTADPLRKVYSFLDDSYQQYVGHQLAAIPAPDDKGRPEGEGSYSEYFLRPFLEALQDTGTEVRVVDNHQAYLEGKYAEHSRTVCENVDTIREIIERVSGRELSSDWHPYSPLDSKGSLDGVVVQSYEWPYIYWTDSHGVSGKADLRKGDGKLPWRIDWPARWDWNGITCEPFGKDHAAAGGSYDTGKEICTLFGNEAPMSLPYEWISLKGQGAMSSSKGVVLTARELLDITPPEIMRFLVANNKPRKAIQFDTGEGLIGLADEYERLGGQIPNMLKDIEDEEISRRKKNQIEDSLGAWRLSQTVHGDMISTTSSISFSHLSLVAQMKQDDAEVWKSLQRSHGIDAQNPNAVLVDRLMRMRNWISGSHFPESSRIVVNDAPEQEWLDSLEDKELEFIKSLHTNLPSEFNEDSTRNWVSQACSDSELAARDAYRVLYRLIISKDRGPRIASLLATMDSEQITTLLSSAI